ncbi:hypothetical protein MBLNU230_g8439t1 [Neophaeotheca triangularis]
MADAWTSGAQWQFPSDLPGSFHNGLDEAGEQIRREAAASEQRSNPASPSDPPTTPPPNPTQEQEQEQPNAQPKKKTRHYPPRQCRICLDTVLPTFHPIEENSEPRVTYDSPEGGRLLRPCKCKGSQKYVHADCLNAWRKADPRQKRNYWQCPTCSYNYRLNRLTWSSRISSTAAQIALTVLIFVTSMFILGFVADPIINLYLDPVSTIATAGGPTGSFIFEDEAPSWGEHFIKGLASLGLLGFAKVLMGLSPWHWFNMRGGGFMGGGGIGRSAVGGTGRGRIRELSWITILVGICAFLWAVWKGVRAWSRKTLESAGDKVMDVHDEEEDDDDD